MRNRSRDRKLQEKSSRDIEYFVVPLELSLDRKASSSKHVFFEGYAAIFNTPDAYKDIILPGAFKKTLKEKGPKVDKKTGEVHSDIVSLWQHNPDWPFGLPQHMEEDSKGLFHRTMISATRENEDRIQYMEDRVVKGQSIGFVTLDYEWDDEEDLDEMDWWEWPTRFLKQLDLWEVSPVTFQAHSDALTTFIQRNRELMRAVKSVDHGGILETAYGMKGITPPMVEESIRVLTSFKDALESQAGEEIDAEGEEGSDEEDRSGEGVEGSEGDSDGDSEGEPDGEPDTSAEDPELVNELERFAARLELVGIEQRTRRLASHRR